MSLRYSPTPLDHGALATPGSAAPPPPPGRRRSWARPLTLFALVFIASGWIWLDRGSPAPPAFPAPAAIEPIAMVDMPAIPGEVPTDEESAELRYLKRARALIAQAVSDGEVTYGQILEAAYEPGVVTPQVLARKAGYRKRQRAQFVFQADYRLRHDPVNVKEGRPVYDSLLRGWTTGLHSSAERLIIVTPGDGPTILFHEGGHALKTNSGMLRTVSDQVTFAAFQAGRLDDAEERRLRYLTEQKEIEVSLQDLNRFHACVVAGRPIMNAHDAISALTAIGLSLEYADVQPLFAAEKTSLSPEQFRLAHRRPPDARGAALRQSYVFPDAQRLATLQRLALRADRSLWPPLLRKLIFEAPGHL